MFFEDQERPRDLPPGLPVGPGRPDQGERAGQGPPDPRRRGHRLRSAGRQPAGRGRGHHPHGLHHPVLPEAAAQAGGDTPSAAVRGGRDPRLGERRSREEGGRRRGDRDAPDRLLDDRPRDRLPRHGDHDEPGAAVRRAQRLHRAHSRATRPSRCRWASCWSRWSCRSTGGLVIGVRTPEREGRDQPAEELRPRARRTV